MTKILVVDDSGTVRQQVSLALTQVGYQVVEAHDGGSALAALSHGDVSLAICDVNMPGMNGLELLEHLKRERKHIGVPFVMLTTETAPVVIDRAKRAGARGWIVKPFNAKLMVEAVSNLLRR